MTLPKHAKVPPHRVMRAPYNFVPLPEAVFALDEDDRPDHDRYHDDRHTGYIEVEISTETLLYTRCAYPAQCAGEEIYRSPQRQDFYHHGDRLKPVIPGSSIRGMVRNLVEIIGYAKMLRVDDAKLIYRAVGDPTSLGIHYRKKMLGTGHPLPYPSRSLKGGYLEKNGQWFIHTAREHNGESFVHTKNHPSFAQEREQDEKYDPEKDVIPVWIKPPASRRKKECQHPKPSLYIADVDCSDIKRRTDGTCPGAKWKPAILVRSGHMDGKHMDCVIFEKAPDPDEIPIPREVWRLYEEDREMRRGICCRKLKKSGDPLFYLCDQGAISENNPRGLVFFGPTMMFRIPYEHSILEFVPENLNKRRDALDLSDAIFGTTGFKGRVRFTDAIFSGMIKGSNQNTPFLANDTVNDGRIIPRILSAPKPTAFQNYLVQPIDPEEHSQLRDHQKNRLLLNYNHPFKSSSTACYDLVINQRTGESIKSDGTVIRGHKMYWNKPDMVGDVEENPELVRMDAKGLKEYRSKTSDDFKDADSPKNKPQQTVIRPVCPGCNFRGKIHFENLSKLELGALLTALTLKDAHSRHRLGMGKPYGMGRVRIETRLFTENRRDRYTSFKTLATENASLSKECSRKLQEALLEHYMDNCGGGDVTSIWDIPRLRDLALLLRTDGPARAQDTEYVGLEPGVRRQWTSRQVLPTPSQVAHGNDVEDAELRLDREDVQAEPARVLSWRDLKGARHTPRAATTPSAHFETGPPRTTKPTLEPQPDGLMELPTHEGGETVSKPQRRIKAGDSLVFTVLPKKKKSWQFCVKGGQGQGSLQAGSPVPPDIEEGKEYILEVVVSGNAKNKGMFLRWVGERTKESTQKSRDQGKRL